MKSKALFIDVIDLSILAFVSENCAVSFNFNLNVNNFDSNIVAFKPTVFQDIFLWNQIFSPPLNKIFGKRNFTLKEPAAK